MPEEIKAPVSPARKSFAQSLAESIKPIEDEIAKKVTATTEEPGKTATETKVEAPKTATTTPAADPDDEIMAGKRAPKADDFKRVKTIAGEFKTKAEQAEAKYNDAVKKLQDAEKAPKHNAELISKLEQERDHFRSMFETVSVEFRPDFNAKYTSRIEKIVSDLKSNLPEDAVKMFASILQMPDGEAKREQLAEMMSELDEVQKSEVTGANREIRSIMRERSEEVSRSNETITKLDEERRNKAKARADELGKAFDQQLASVKDPKDGIELFQTKDGDEDWNSQVKEREKVARAIFEDRFESPQDKAEAAIWSATAPGLLGRLRETTAKLAEAEQVIAKMQSSNPSLGTGAGAGGAGAGQRKPFKELMSETLNQK